MSVGEETSSQVSRAAVVALVVVAFVGLAQPWYAAGDGFERVSCSGLDLFACVGGVLVGTGLFVALVAGAVDVVWRAGDTPQWVVRGGLVVALASALVVDPVATLPMLWTEVQPGLQPGWFVSMAGAVMALAVSGSLASAPLPRPASRRSLPEPMTTANGAQVTPRRHPAAWIQS